MILKQSWQRLSYEGKLIAIFQYNFYALTSTLVNSLGFFSVSDNSFFLLILNPSELTTTSFDFRTMALRTTAQSFVSFLTFLKEVISFILT